jgi:NAD(P)-dependent dehydrogenase (short-subunit alcohol dehydrogenase family)
MQQQLFERIRVQRPVSDCYSYLRDFSNIEQWDPSVYRAEKLGADPSMPASYRLSFNRPSKQLTMHYQETHAEENKLVSLEGYSLADDSGDNPGRLHAVDDIEFEALGPELTEIRYRATLTFDGLPSALSPLFKPALNRLSKRVAKGIADALTPKPSPRATPKLSTRIHDQLILPGAIKFSKHGYLNMADKALSERMDGKVVVLTGPTSGLGLAAAKLLAGLGATLVLLGRGDERLQECTHDVLNSSGCEASNIHSYNVELSSLAQTAATAKQLLSDFPKIDVLINNAGALFAKREESEEGNELALAVNLLSPVLLSKLLSPALTANSRIVNVVSGGLYLSALRQHDMQWNKSKYNGSGAYANAKRALLCYTQIQQQKALPATYAMHPGWAATPGVEKSLPAFNRLMSWVLRDSRMAADTAVWLASAAKLPLSGALWLDRQPHPTSVIPGTEPSALQQAWLEEWLDDQLAPYL